MNKRNPRPPTKIPIQTESFSRLQEVTRTMQDFEADYVRLLLTKPPKNMYQTNSGMKKNGGNPHGYQNRSCRPVIRIALSCSFRN